MPGYEIMLWIGLILLVTTIVGLWIGFLFHHINKWMSGDVADDLVAYLVGSGLVVSAVLLVVGAIWRASVLTVST